MVQFTRQFALFKQTILNDTRSGGLQLLRFIFVAALAIIIFIAEAEARRWRQIDGRFLFEAVFIVNLFFVVTAALFLFLPLVREEKEENTLGLILMTGISPFAYLTGKVGSRLAMMLMMLSIQIPIVYLCITMGGIDLNTIMLAYTLLILIGFFLGTAFLLGSLLGSSVFTSLLITSGIVLIISYFGNFILQNHYYSSNYEEPFILLDRALNSIFSNRAGRIESVVIYYFSYLFASGSLLFCCSVYFFNALTADQKEIDIPKNLKGKESSEQKAESLEGTGLKPLYRKLKTKRFGKLPLIYKDFRFTCYGPLLYLAQFSVIFIGIFVVLFDTYHYRGHWLFTIVDEGIPFMFFQTAIVLLICSNIVFSFEIKHKTLGSLLLLPQNHTRLFWQKSLCVFRIAAPSIICLFIVTALNIYFKIELESYYRLDRTITEFIILLSVLLSGYFINTWLSLVFKKYSFFLSIGLTFGWYVMHIFLIEFTHMYRHEESIVFMFLISGLITTPFAIILAQKRLEKLSVTS